MILDQNGFAQLVLGSAGSNRIRSAIIQVLSNFLIKKYSLKKSVYSPRIHLEGTDLHIEPGLKDSLDLDKLGNVNLNEFSNLNLFFGGVNAVSPNEAISDPRRGGYAIKC